MARRDRQSHYQSQADLRRRKRRELSLAASLPVGSSAEDLQQLVSESDQADIQAVLAAQGRASEAETASSTAIARDVAAAGGYAGTGMEQALRGSLSAGSVKALNLAEATRKAEVLGELEGPERLAPIKESLESELGKISEEIRKQRELGTGIAATGSAIGGGATAAGTALSSTPATAPIGAPLAVAGALTSLFSALHGNVVAGEADTPKRRRQKKDAERQHKLAERSVPSASKYAAILSPTQGYSGYQTDFGGGSQLGRRPFIAEEDIYGV